METAIQKITTLPKTKKEQSEFAGQIITAIMEGEIDPLKIDIYLKSIEDTIKLIRKEDRVKELTLDEASKYEGKEFSAFGANIKICSRRNYDFKNDPKWIDLDRQKREHEKLLKAIPDGEEIVDPETGEIIGSKLKSVTQYLTITF